MNQLCIVRRFRLLEVTSAQRQRWQLTFSTRSSGGSNSNNTTANNEGNAAWKSDSKQQLTKTIIADGDKKVIASIDIKQRRPRGSEPKFLDRLLLTLKGASSKNVLLARLTKRPIDVIEWSQMPQQKRVDSSIRKSARFLFSAVVILVGHVLALIFMSKQHEITGRRYFRMFEESLIIKADDIFATELTEKHTGHFVNSSDPILQEMDVTLRRLITANKEALDDERFEHSHSCILIDDAKPWELSLYSHRFLIFTTGLMKMCENEHQRAYVIANTLAHYILKHKREPSTNYDWRNVWTSVKLFYTLNFWNFFDWSKWFPNSETLGKIDSIDEAASKFCYRAYRRIDATVAYGRDVEDEADRIAMQLLARACYNVREVEKFTRNCLNKKAQDVPKPITLPADHYLVRHAVDEKKLGYIHSNIERFMQFRLECKCEPIK